MWSCEAGGVEYPPGYGVHGTGLPMHLVYFDNQLDVQKGRERIAFNRLRDDARSTNMIASCCKALLCVEHPGYVGQSVLLFPDFITILGVPPLLPPACRIFIKDWPADAYAKLPPKPGIWWEEGKMYGHSEQHKALAGKSVEGMLQAMPLSAIGETFQQLLEAVGGKVEVLGLPEGPNSRRKKRVETLHSGFRTSSPSAWDKRSVGLLLSHYVSDRMVCNMLLQQRQSFGVARGRPVSWFSDSQHRSFHNGCP
ncbi:unnamed protein product [Symbiodinium necroappetens]|uniref:Uncharacterized protein n=1 Tax=Symbiodinium necroappetens TaxID=1628268 RepID=A0A813CHH6_9DINO|nr:unnamed protein product [Symbiodinium necroappetens]